MTSTPKQRTLIYFSILSFIISYITLYALKSYLLPVLGSVILIYLTKPLQDFLKRYGLSSVTSACIISFTLFSVICLIIVHGVPLIISELNRLIMQLPSNITTTYQILNQFLEPYDIVLDSYDIPSIASQIIQKQDFTSLQTIPKILASTLSRFVDIILFFTSVLFIPLFFFFAMRTTQDLGHSLLNITPPIIREEISDFLVLLDETLSIWVAGQGTVLIILAILYSTGLKIIGIPYAITLGVITGFMYIVPVAGPFLAFVLTIVITIAYSGVKSLVLLKVLAFFAITQSIESMILSPFLIGNRLGLDLPTSMLVILIGGGLFGGIGVLFAIPTASLIKKTILLVQEKQSESWICD